MTWEFMFRSIMFHNSTIINPHSGHSVDSASLDIWFRGCLNLILFPSVCFGTSSSSVSFFSFKTFSLKRTSSSFGISTPLLILVVENQSFVFYLITSPFFIFSSFWYVYEINGCLNWTCRFRISCLVAL